MIRKLTYLVILATLGFSAVPASAFFENTVVSPRARSMGESSVAVADAAYAAFLNPGQLGSITTAKIGAIRRLGDHTMDFVRRREPKVYSRELVDTVFEQPYCRIANVVEVGIAQHPQIRIVRPILQRAMQEAGLAGVDVMGADRILQLEFEDLAPRVRDRGYRGQGLLASI